ncbi:hypothetical protein [Mesorhizobium abyssinicae]|uniref:hypothetical protein n=1 Tax=Mesorhizobium abyssinicae TaxID=1209958 RepID=UPI002A2410A6|nr:hypothetical protein [Mesorhizobium abyssinicae]
MTAERRYRGVNSDNRLVGRTLDQHREEAVVDVAVKRRRRDRRGRQMVSGR